MFPPGPTLYYFLQILDSTRTLYSAEDWVTNECAIIGELLDRHLLTQQLRILSLGQLHRLVDAARCGSLAMSFDRRGVPKHRCSSQ
jgi:hypothetical protein